MSVRLKHLNFGSIPTELTGLIIHVFSKSGLIELHTNSVNIKKTELVHKVKRIVDLYTQTQIYFSLVTCKLCLDRC